MSGGRGDTGRGAVAALLDSLREDRRGRLVVAALITFVAHSAAGVAVWRAPEPEPWVVPESTRTSVRTFDQTVTLRKPPPPKPAPTPPPPPPPVVTPPPPPVVAPPPAEVASAPAPAAAPARPKGPKPKSTKPATKPPPSGPKSVQLSNVGTTGNVRVYEGASDSFGSPTAPPRDETEEPERPVGDGPPDSTGTAPTGNGPGGTGDGVGGELAKTVAPKVMKRVYGEYPTAAPRTGRPIALTLKLEIDGTGTVTAASVISKPPIAGTFFDAEAVRVAKATRFTPASRGGTPIPFSIRYVVKFEPP
ncbi:MAG: energy transducer TonB [Myxococcales bacterium]|nr:energy transducer TonB [Myxococcales bacterium]